MAQAAMKTEPLNKPLKVTIGKTELQHSLTHMQGVLERRNTLAILGNIALVADGDSLRLNATDMDLEVVESVPAKVEKRGATTVSGLTLYEIVRKIPDGAEISLDNTETPNRLIIKSGRSRFQLSTLPIEDFPIAHNVPMTHHFSIAAAELKRLIDRTRFAISTEETRYYLNGIYLHAPEVNDTYVLRAVATDGHRLARLESPLPDGAKDMPGIIIPRKTVQELRKLLDEASGSIQVSLSEARIQFQFADITISSKLIDGTFPDYQRVIPEGNDKVLQVDCEEFTRAVDRVSTIATEKTRAIKMQLQSGTLMLSASSAEQGTAEEKLEVSYRSEAMEIGFNARYMMDIMQQIEGDAADIQLSDAASPALIRDQSDASAVYVLMPMRV